MGKKVSLSSKKDNPKGYKTSTSRSMKESGAKYSTTNRKGETSFYSSSKDVDAGKDPIQRMKNGVVIPANNLTPVDKVTMPPMPTPADPGDIAGANNKAMTGLSAMGYTVDDKGLFSYSAPTQETQPSSFSSIFNQYMGAQEAPPSTADIYAKELRRSGVEDLQQEVNNKTSQLNAITANSQAEQLKLEGQGRGQTSGFIGGEQARINREAAIAALPVQAQLSAAQGNLEMAQQQLNTMFTLKAQDAQAKYQYKQKVLDTVFQFANAEQQRKLDAIKLQEDRAYDMQKTNLGIANQWAMQAMEYGQSTVAGQIMALKSNSPTYQADLARLQGQVRKPVAPVAAPKRDTQVVDGKLIDMQTGEVISNVGGTSAKPQTEGQAKANTFADRLLESEKVLANSDKFGSFFSRGGVLPNWAKTSDRQEFEQSQRNFINAVLRRESGAVIADSEFANARQQYFPQPGDGDGVLAQKRSNRNTVINGFYREANVPRPVNAGDIIESGGKRYKVAADGVTLEEI